MKLFKKSHPKLKILSILIGYSAVCALGMNLVLGLSLVAMIISIFAAISSAYALGSMFLV